MKWVSKGKEKVFLFDDNRIDESLNSTKGIWTGAVIQTNSQDFEMFVGISYVSLKNAKQNLEEEVPNLVWSEVRSQNKAIWEAELSRFEVSLFNKEDQTKFDTALIRTLSSPTLFNDVNREYMSFKND